MSEEPAKPQRVRFCVNNPHTLAERNDLIAKGYECIGCLGNCTRCFETRFLEIENRFVEGDSYEEILDHRRDEPSGDDEGSPIRDHHQ